MALSHKYVSSSGVATWVNASNISTPCSLETAFTNATAENVVWIANDGTYHLPNGDAVSGTGNVFNNTHIYFIGYHNPASIDLVNLISDMSAGGANYGGPLNPTKTNGWVDIDFDNRFGTGIAIVSKANVVFRNLYFHNTDRQYGSDLLILGGTTKLINFINCKFDDAYYFSSSAAIDIGIFDCWFGTTLLGLYVTNNLTHRMWFDSCVINNSLTNSTFAGMDIYSNCIIKGGDYGLYSYYSDYGLLLYNNVFYNQTVCCIGNYNYTNGNTIREYNNIYMPAEAADVWINLGGVASLGYSGYSCAWSVAGSALTTPYAGQYGLNVDPQFVDAAGGDFRVRNQQVLRGGRPDIAGNAGQIGVVQQKYQFADRARVVNRGRLGILR